MKKKDRRALSHFENTDDVRLRVELEKVLAWAYRVSGEEAVFAVFDLRFDIADHGPSQPPNGSALSGQQQR